MGSLIRHIPDFGPLDITDEKDFFEKSRAKFLETWMKPVTYTEKPNDFNHLALLGQGSFGRVILVQQKVTEKLYAMKAMKRNKLVKLKQLPNIKYEKNILQSLNSPFATYLVYFFVDNSYIYIVMPFLPGGELYFHMNKHKVFSETNAKFYVGQAILALEYLHFLDFTYRDIKPENIVLDHTGYAKLVDFGFCKYMKGKNRTYTLCGTPNYLAPEVILNKGYGKSVDWWGIGILMYEVVAGIGPFDSNNAINIYNNIVENKYKIPKFFTPELKDLIHNILQSDTTKRFGNLKNGVDDIKYHDWFKDFNWLALLNRKLSPPFLPHYEFPGDISNFENTRKSQLKSLTVHSSEEFPTEFKNF